MKDQTEKDLFHVEIMLERFLRIGEDLERFAKLGISWDDEMVMDNLAFQLIQAGEQVAQDKLSVELREANPDIDWRKIKGYRNFMAHSYHRTNKSILKNIALKEVPIWIEKLEPLRKQLTEKLN